LTEKLFDPETDVVLPRIMFDQLCHLNRKFNGIQLALEWVTKNPQHKKDFVQIFGQLDRQGFESFCLSTNYYLDVRKKDVNILTLAKRALKHQGESFDRQCFRDQLAHEGPLTLTMSNGLECTLKQDHTWGRTAYWASISCKDVTVHLRLNLRQVHSFRKTKEDVKMLRRLKPQYIVYETNGEKHTLDSQLNLAVINAIVARDSVNVVPLVA
jgi:hypothetical protein